MNRLLLCLFLSLLSLLPSTVFAQAEWYEPPWTELSTSQMASDPILPLLSWEPDGTNDGLVSRDCRRAALERVIEGAATGAAETAARLSRWLKRCEGEINRASSPRFAVLLQLINVNHAIKGNPWVKKVAFNLADGRKLNGFMAFKPGNTPRPVVIAKCGLYCNADDNSAMRNLFMHLFEESPFHVVLLASSTGSEFSIANKSIAFGGFDEGYQILEVARLLRSPESSVASRISSVHAIGLSMGSQGLLYSSLYASGSRGRFTPISSAFALCPVVDLGATIEQGFDPSARGLYYRIMTLQTLRQVFSKVPILGDIINIDSKLGRTELYRGVTQAAVRYYKELTEQAPWAIPPLSGVQIHNLADLWAVNRFQDHVQGIQVPTLLVHMKDDYFVRSDTNAYVLEEKLRHEPAQNIGVVGFAKGNHCALAASNGWDTMTALYRSFIIAHSPEIGPFITESRVNIGPSVADWHWPLKYFLRKDEKIMRVAWHMKPGKDSVRVTFTVFTPYPSGESIQCFREEIDPTAAPPFCLRELRGNIPLSLFASIGLKPARDNYEASAMTRWLNTSSDLLNESGEPLIGSDRRPGQLIIRGRYEL